MSRILRILGEEPLADLAGSRWRVLADSGELRAALRHAAHTQAIITMDVRTTMRRT